MNANVTRILAASAALGGALGAAPLAANAQTPAYAQSPSYASHSETITGTISSIQNINHIFVADDRGFTDDVTIRAGADVLSNGARLEPGRRVTIVGSNGGNTFVADRISTAGPSFTGGYAYAPAPVVYPVPVYAPAYAYRPYHPISVGLFFHFR